MHKRASGTGKRAVLLESPLFPGITLPVRQLFVDVLQPKRPPARDNPFRTPGA